MIPLAYLVGLSLFFNWVLVAIFWRYYILQKTQKQRNLELEKSLSDLRSQNETLFASSKDKYQNLDAFSSKMLAFEKLLKDNKLEEGELKKVKDLILTLNKKEKHTIDLERRLYVYNKNYKNLIASYDTKLQNIDAFSDKMLSFEKDLSVHKGYFKVIGELEGLIKKLNQSNEFLSQNSEAFSKRMGNIISRSNKLIKLQSKMAYSVIDFENDYKQQEQ